MLLFLLDVLTACNISLSISVCERVIAATAAVRTASFAASSANEFPARERHHVDGSVCVSRELLVVRFSIELPVPKAFYAL